MERRSDAGRKVRKRQQAKGEDSGEGMGWNAKTEKGGAAS